jgi:putative SOS response-associated peptidase YedK
MCGRFTLRTPLTVLAQQFLFDLGELPADFALVPRMNIAPTLMIPAVRQRAEGAPRQLALVRWGLIPSWSKESKGAAKLINARAETVAEKPAFRSAFARRRCLLLADGFYEWRNEGTRKIPCWFRLRGERPFAFAGLWERWSIPPGDPLFAKAAIDEFSGERQLESATIITTNANELCAPIHDRMPVIVHPDHYNLWLSPATKDQQQLLKVLRPYPSDEMKTEPIDSIPTP